MGRLFGQAPLGPSGLSSQTGARRIWGPPLTATIALVRNAGMREAMVSYEEKNSPCAVPYQAQRQAFPTLADKPQAATARNERDGTL